MWLAATMQGQASISLGHEPTKTRLSLARIVSSITDFYLGMCAPDNDASDELSRSSFTSPRHHPPAVPSGLTLAVTKVLLRIAYSAHG